MLLMWNPSSPNLCQMRVLLEQEGLMTHLIRTERFQIAYGNDRRSNVSYTAGLQVSVRLSFIVTLTMYLMTLTCCVHDLAV